MKAVVAVVVVACAVFACANNESSHTEHQYGFSHEEYCNNAPAEEHCTTEE